MRDTRLSVETSELLCRVTVQECNVYVLVLDVVAGVPCRTTDFADARGVGRSSGVGVACEVHKGHV